MACCGPHFTVLNRREVPESQTHPGLALLIGPLPFDELVADVGRAMVGADVVSREVAGDQDRPVGPADRRVLVQTPMLVLRVRSVHELEGVTPLAGRRNFSLPTSCSWDTRRSLSAASGQRIALGGSCIDLHVDGAEVEVAGPWEGMPVGHG